MKESYYFPHDYHARNDPKCAALLNDFGASGYGLYWCIIEILHEQKDGKLEKFPKLFSGLAYDFNVSIEAVTKQIEAMLNDYNLLQEDENYIWSERVLQNLNERKLKYHAKSEAGRMGGLKSGESRKMKQNEALLEANEPKERKRKEKKGKEIKVNNKKLYIECVYLTDDEYKKLIEKFGEIGTQQRLQNLNDGILSKGYKYDSHYHTILTWERKNNGQAGRSKQPIIEKERKPSKYAGIECEEINTDDPGIAEKV